jgi:PIN domain nuclease of toxin-antitoxin system
MGRHIFRKDPFSIIGLDVPVVLNASQLPGNFHPNPVDRMLVSTARQHDLILLTEDQKILEYARLGYLRACSSAQTKSLES